MTPESFIVEATNVAAWLQKSRELRASADALWTLAWDQATTLLNTVSKPSDTERTEMEGLVAMMETAKMLYGLAFETVLKAIILRERPESIELKLTANGSGKIRRAEMRQFGVPMSLGHDLVRLAELAGLFVARDGAIFATPEARIEACDVLSDLGQAVVWTARYPVPTHSDRWASEGRRSYYAWNEVVKAWADELLDYYHRRVAAELDHVVPSPIPKSSDNTPRQRESVAAE